MPEGMKRTPTAKLDIAQVMAHAGAPAEVGDEQNEALIRPEALARIFEGFDNFLWVRKDGSACCTACGREMSGAGLAGHHKTWVACPECGHPVQIRAKRYGRKNLKKTFYAVDWRKSEIQKDTLVMVGYYCEMDSSGDDPERAEKKIVPVLVDVFAYGAGSVRIQRPVYSFYERDGLCNWYKCKDVRALGVNYFGAKVFCMFGKKNFDDAIFGTPFTSAVSTIEAARKNELWTIDGDRSEIIDAIARRPWIEYMAKAGFEKLAVEAMGVMPKGTLNYNGKNIREIMKLSRDRYAEIRGKHLDIDGHTLRILQLADASGTKIKLEMIQRLARQTNHEQIADVIRWRKKLSAALISYMNKNYGQTLRDYWRMADEIGLDMSAPEAEMPPNLREAHDRLTLLHRDWQAQRWAKQNESLEKKLEKRLKGLEARYCFAHGNLILRPARRLTELINEGNKLCHCVGSYTEAYASGRTDICFLRRADAPDVPWRTIEFEPKSGRKVQDRGYRNDRAQSPGSEPQIAPEIKAELAEFWAAFEAWRSGSALKQAV